MTLQSGKKVADKP